MTDEHSKSQGAHRERKKTEEEKWFGKDDLQDLAKLGGDLLKKTVASGFDAIKEVKGNLPKEASQLISRGKEELIKTLSQETIKTVISFSIEKFFATARAHQLEFSIRIRKKEDGVEELHAGENHRSVLKKRRRNGT
jgi:hypothetical protein